MLRPPWQGKELCIWNEPFATGKFSGPTFIASLNRRLSRYPQHQTAQIKSKLFRSLVKINQSKGDTFTPLAMNVAKST
jgi:hypothetical protein